MVFSFQTSNTFSFFLLWRVLQCVPGMIKTPLAKVVSKDDEHETDTLGCGRKTPLFCALEVEKVREREREGNRLQCYTATVALVL